LRPGVRFHDGSPLDAEAVKRSFEDTIRARGEEQRASFSALDGIGAFLSGDADEITGIRVLDENRVEFALNEPLPIYPALLTEAGTAIARRGPDDETARSLGTGAFKIVSLSPEKIVLERFDGYWRTVPRLDALEFHPGVSSADIAKGLRAGTYDVGRDLSAEALEEIRQDPSFRGRIREIPGKHSFFVIFNVKCGPNVPDVAVRRVLNQVVDVRDLVWNTKGQLAEPATGLIPPGILGHDPGRRRPHLTMDEARAAMAEARGGDTTPLKLTAAISPGNQQRHRALIDGVFTAWRELGVEVEVVTPTLERYDEMTSHPDQVDLIALGWISDFDDPDALTHELFDSALGRYRQLFSSDPSDALLHDARSASDPETRIRLYRQFEQLLEEEGAVLPLFHEISYRMPGPKVRGLALRSTPPYINYRELGKAAENYAGTTAGVSRGGTVRVPIIQHLVGTMDPIYTNHVDQAEVVANVYETLTRVAEDARVVPWLLSGIEAEDGGTRYRCRLRDGVRFHNGRRLTLRDVRFSLERILLTEDCEHRWLLSPIKGAKAMIEGTSKELTGMEIHSTLDFSIHLETPFPSLPAVLSHLGLAIVPERIDLERRSWREGLVGTGPFRVTRFVPGERVELERHPSYWREGYPHCEALLFESVPDAETLYEEFKRGRFSIAHYLRGDHAEELRRSTEFGPGYRELPGLSVALASFNTKSGPLTDRETRRRLVAVIDRDALARAGGGNRLATAQGIIPPGLLGYSPQGGLAQRPRQVIPPPDGKPVHLTAAVSPTMRANFKDTLEVFSRDISEAGFELEFLPVETREDFFDITMGGKSDVSIIGWVADYPDTHAMVQGLLDSREGYAGRYIGSEDLDRLIAAAQVEIDPAKRHAIYREIEETAAREAILVPLFHYQIYRFARPELKGLALSFSSPEVLYENLWVEG
jgi:ABC-type transport system substrate-binding protein